ncbi:MAG: VWA domain-containing protein [Acidobacteriota bacterium]
MRRRMLRIGFVMLAGLLAAARPSAQPPAPPPKPQTTFRAATHLIVHPVTVKDKEGKPVLGLTAKDFVVTENGVPQNIAFVEYEAIDASPGSATTSVTTVPAEPPAASAGVAPTTLAGVSLPRPGDTRYRGRRLLILYFDLYRMPPFEQMRTFLNADKYVSTLMTPADLVAVMLFEGRGIVLKQNFTDDRGALREVIRELTVAADARANGMAENWDPGGAFGENDDAFNLFATDRQLAALQTAVTDLGPLPELKTLVYFGSGLRLTGIDNQAQLRATVNAAVRSNVTLNPVDARGLVATPPLGDATRPSPGGVGMFSGAIAQSMTTRFQQSQDALYSLAKDTGGRAMFDNNDLALGIVQAAGAVTGYYLIGYYTNNTATDGRFRRVKVTLNGELSADVSYRPGYYSDKEYGQFTNADKERQLADALRLEDPITDIPMAMEVNYFQLSSAEYYVPVSVRMPGRELTAGQSRESSRIEIDMIGEIKDEHGVTNRNMRDKIQVPVDASGTDRLASRLIQYETGFTVLPGTYVIKVLARNAATGRIGTFQSSFVIPNLERERTRLPISSVVLSSQRVAKGDALFTVKQRLATDDVNPLIHDGAKLVPSVTRTFSATRPLFVLLQAYPRDATAMRPLAAFVTFYRDGARIFETEALGVTDGWDPGSRAVPIRFTINLGGLTPGPYDCQVTVLDPGGGKAAFWRVPVVITR